ncbi:MAG: hypothetical protein ACE149_20050 [Armatimonadota bacterium]
MSRFRAGAARRVITPHIGCHLGGLYEDRIATDAQGDLHARALVLDSGDTAAVVCVCDLLSMPKETADRAKARAEELTGIPPANILIAATHTHFGPATYPLWEVPREDAYMEWLPSAIADAIKLAHNRLRPALLGHSSGDCPELVFNRRYRMKDGSVQTNPGRDPAIVGPAGPTDPEVGFLVVLEPDRTPIAVLANYALHYVGGPELRTVLHADYFGSFDLALQRIAGHDLVGIMLNGCCGDINHIDVTRSYEYPYPFAEIDRVADVVAGGVYQSWRGIQSFAAAPELRVANSTYRMRRREVTPARLAQAQERLERIRRGEWPPAALERPDVLFDITAMKIADTPLEWEIPIQAMRIGDLGIAALPPEVFVEIGLDIKRRSPFARTLVGSLCNDSIDGYIPTAKAYDEGSYEVWSSPAERGTGEGLADAAVDLLARVHG